MQPMETDFHMQTLIASWILYVDSLVKCSPRDHIHFMEDYRLGTSRETGHFQARSHGYIQAFQTVKASRPYNVICHLFRVNALHLLSILKHKDCFERSLTILLLTFLSPCFFLNFLYIMIKKFSILLHVFASRQ